jgi:hypothetical protein
MWVGEKRFEMKKLQKLSAVFALAATSLVASRSMAGSVGGINLGNLTDYLFVFTNGSVDANWQSASPGYSGDVAVNGLVASERTSGNFDYTGTIYTNAANQGAWQSIINNNPGTAFGSANQTSRISGLVTDLSSAFTQINGLSATAGYTSRSVGSLDGLNTQNGINETFVINVTSGFTDIQTAIDITGDAGDVFILRWDTDTGTAGYQGAVKFNNTTGLTPHGGLTKTNFINVAGDIDASGGSGAYFNGYWLTTGAADGTTHSLSNAIFDGGWYTSTTKFSLTSGSGGEHLGPPVGAPGTPLPSAALGGLGLLGLLAAKRTRRHNAN